MRNALRIFTGNTQASQVPFCWPNTAPVSPATLKGLLGSAPRVIWSELFGMGKRGMGCRLWGAARAEKTGRRNRDTRIDPVRQGDIILAIPRPSKRTRDPRTG